MTAVIVPNPNTVRGPIELTHNALRDAREKTYRDAQLALENTYHSDLATLKTNKEAALIAAGLNADGGVPDGYGSPRNTVAPAITGTAQVGQVLTCSTGTWSPTGTYTRQWYKGAVPISGATGGTYTPIVGDIGGLIKCKVTATNPYGAQSKFSNITTAVIAA